MSANFMESLVIQIFIDHHKAISRERHPCIATCITIKDISLEVRFWEIFQLGRDGHESLLHFVKTVEAIIVRHHP